jgi:hypothetical protein
VRTNNETRIAKERQSSMRHARRLIIEDRQYERLALGGNRSGKGQWQQARWPRRGPVFSPGAGAASCTPMRLPKAGEYSLAKRKATV